MNDNSETKPVDFYWRPGCPFCARLEHGLNKSGVTLRKHNIWENPQAAAVVRAAANGNETVPTVAIGQTTMVNPRVEEVLDELAT